MAPVSAFNAPTSLKPVSTARNSSVPGELIAGAVIPAAAINTPINVARFMTPSIGLKRGNANAKR
jgi:hypothetical protein